MRVAKWGNSLAIRLPAAVTEALKLEEGDEVEIRIAGARLLRIRRDPARGIALAGLRKLTRPLPKGFVFDRDDTHAR
jgi:antitoxin MazE